MGFYNSPRIITDDLIFSIDAANIKSWNGPSPLGTPYGYFGGGEPGPGYLSTVERLDFSSDTDTAVVKGPLSVAKRSMAATGNNDYGYWAGGYAPSRSSLVDRIDYSNDTATAAPKGNLSVGQVEYSATGNASYGYFGGGEGVPGAVLTTVDRIDYSSDTSTATPKGPLSVAKEKFGSTGNASYGYMGGGKSHPNYYSQIDRIDYSSDTSTALAKGPLSGTNYLSAATGNASYGYWGGGKVPANTTITQRLDYSSDTTTASAKGPLSNCQYYMGATGNTSYGYWGSGSGQPGSYVTTVDRLDFSSDGTTCSPKGPLTITRYALAAASPHANANPTSESIWKDTSKNGDNATVEGAAHQDANSGSFAFNGTSNYASNDDKSNLQLGSGNFTFAAWIKPNASTQGTDFGYFGGGYNPSAVQSGINRIDFSNDTATASQVSQFAGASPSSRNQLRTLFGVASSTYAYWGGGTHGLGSESTSIFRLDFSNDTTNTSAIGNLPAAGSNLSAVGNASYGYINGDSKTTVNRIDYSNDDTTTAVKGDLNQTRVYPGATGNSSYGWFGGGGPSRSSVDRVDYSNDTATASARGDLTRSATFLAATGNSNYGYWGGGGPGTKSLVDRVDYSNDTPTASLKGPLTAARYRLGATGNSDYGYFAGGNPGPQSTVDRIDYSNDTATASPKGSLNISPGTNGKMELAGASSRANALPTSDRSNNQGIISYSDSGGNEDATTCQFDTDIDGKVKFSSSAGIVTSTSALPSGTWAHAAVTRTDNTISVYVNGVLENTGITTHTFSDYAKVTIGANRPRSTFFKGDIAQVQIYKKALSSDEVQQNYRSIKKRFDL